MKNLGSIFLTLMHRHFFSYLKDNFFGYLAVIVLLIPVVFIPKIETFYSIKVAVFYVLIGASLFTLFQKRNKIVMSPALMWSMGLFLLGCLISVIFSRDPINSFVGSTFRWSGMLFFLCLSFFVTALTNSFDDSKVKFIINLFLGVALVNSIIALLQTFGIGYYENYTNMGSLYRAPGLVGNPNFLAIFLLAIVPFAIAMFIEAKTFKFKIYYALSSFIVIWAIIFLQSRGAVLGLASTLVVFFGFYVIGKFSKRAKLIVVSVLVMFVGLFFLFGNLTRPTTYSDALTASDENSVNRLIAWDISLQGMAKNPIIGTGLGNFQLLYKEFVHFQLTSYFDDAHNLYLQLGSTGGLLCLAGFALINALAFYFLYRKIRRDQSWTAIATFSALIGVLLSVSFTPVEIVCWVTWGILIAIAFYDPARTISIPLNKKFGLTAAILLMIYGGYFFLSCLLAYMGATAYLRGNYETASKLLVNNEFTNPVGFYTDFYKLKTDIALADNPSDLAKVAVDVASYGHWHKNFSSIYIAKGILYYSIYKKDKNPAYYQSALENMNKGLELDPFFGGAKFRLAYMYLANNDLANANSIISDYTITNGTNFSGWVMLAEIERRQGHVENAFRVLSQGFMHAKLYSDAKQFNDLLVDQKYKNFDLEKYLSGYLSFDITDAYPF